MLRSTSPNSTAFFRDIIIYLCHIFDYLDLFYRNDKEEIDFVKDINKDWDYTKTDIDINSDEKNQSFENKEWKNTYSDIDKIDINLDGKIFLKKNRR